jgi:hypothetical protein
MGPWQMDLVKVDEAAEPLLRTLVQAAGLPGATTLEQI